MTVNYSGVPRESLRGRLFRLPLALVPKGMVVPVLQGPCRGMRWVVGSGPHGCWLGSYEAEKMAQFVRALRAGHVVYDIGANVGVYSLAASRLVGTKGRVLAVEPLPRNLAFLRRHVQMNHCANVTLLPVALSDENGTALFDNDTDAFQGHLSANGRLEVPVARLDDIVKIEKLPPPGVIKMDVEGAEAKVLAGGENMISQFRPLIFLATHGAEVKQECLKWLRAHGYSIESLSEKDEESADEFMAQVRG